MSVKRLYIETERGMFGAGMGYALIDGRLVLGSFQVASGLFMPQVTEMQPTGHWIHGAIDAGKQRLEPGHGRREGFLLKRLRRWWSGARWVRYPTESDRRKDEESKLIGPELAQWTCDASQVADLYALLGEFHSKEAAS